MIELLWIPALVGWIIGFNKLLDWHNRSAVERTTKVLTQNAVAIAIAKPAVQSLGPYRNNAFGPAQDPALLLKTTEDLLALSGGMLDRVQRDLVKVREIHELVDVRLHRPERVVERHAELGHRKRLLLK